jgi:citrate synthase
LDQDGFGMSEETTEQTGTKNVGLRGVTIADTRVSHVEGEQGRLIYRGFDIEVLAENSTYEEVAYLLLFGELPSGSQLATFSRRLGVARSLSPLHIRLLRSYKPDLRPTDLLQSLLAALSETDPRPGQESKEAYRERAIDLVGKVGSLVAAWHRLREGREPVPSNADLSHAADFLRMLHDKPAGPEQAGFLDVALTLHADHSLNASTFVARAVTSTRAHMYAAASAAMGALSGELHGGANMQVMQMLMQIGDPARVESYVQERLAAGDRVMGMGHAVYRTYDPRALILERLSRQLAEHTGQVKWYEMTRKVQEVTQRIFHEQKGVDIYPNVDLYSAGLYHVLGIPWDLFTPVFALARTAGWGAHIIEERFAEAQEKPQLYRPLADYVGNYCGPESCVYSPLEERR